MSITSTENRKLMLELARSSIRHWLDSGTPAIVDLSELPDTLQQPGACFVTLEINNQLRGCIGSLEAYRPLAEDLAENSYAAAFRDPRFPPLTPAEYSQTAVKISLLTPPQPMQFNSEDDLLIQLRPGIDGVILSEWGHRGTFLPSVWEQIPAPRLFLQQLKRKAGLPGDYWSDSVKIERYQTELIA